jgi:hypothetical protein
MDVPTDLTEPPIGQPVCLTKKFIYGKENTDTCGDDASSYEVIVNEDECRYAHNCLSTCAIENFHEWETGDEMRYPKGCHKRAEDGCYAFNPGPPDPPPVSASKEKIEMQGTPVCRDKAAPPYKADTASPSLAAVSGRVLEVGSVVVQEKEASNPCSYLGCNSAKCEWASGGRIRRVKAAKACSNALVLGSSDSISNMTSAVGTPLVKIETLTQCMHAVKARQDDGCSGHFQMHKETWTCSCVPSGSTCSEKEDKQVCRFEVVD